MTRQRDAQRLLTDARTAFAELQSAQADVADTERKDAEDFAAQGEEKAIAVKLARGILEQRLRQLAVAVELLDQHLRSLASTMAPDEALAMAEHFVKLRTAVGTVADCLDF